MKRKIAAVCISISLLLNLPIAAGAGFTAAESSKGYVIFDADPCNVSEEDGANAYPSGLYNGKYGSDRIGGTSKVKYDEDIPYYLLEFKTGPQNNNILIENGYMCNDGTAGRPQSNISTGFMGWMQYPEIIRAIKDYTYISYDVYTETPVTLSIYPLHQEMDPWANDPETNCGLFDRYEVTETGKWLTRSVKIDSIADAENTVDNWSQGDIFIQAPGITDNITVKIRSLRLEVKENDRENINNALAAVENMDKKKNFTAIFWDENIPLDNLPKDSEGNTDYFTLLTAYDGESSFGNIFNIENALTEKSHGTVSVQPRQKAGRTVTVSAAPEMGYVLSGIYVTAQDGTAVNVSSAENGNVSFVMPESNVRVWADFTLTAVLSQSRYVIFDCVPEQAAGAGFAPADRLGWSLGCYMNGSGEMDFWQSEHNTPDSVTVFPATCRQSLLYDMRVFEALAGYIHFECDINIDTKLNLKQKPNLIFAPVSRDTEGNFSWEIGNFDYIERYVPGYETCKWFSIDKKGISLSANTLHSNWQGDVLIMLDGGRLDYSGISVNVRRMCLTVDESDRAGINAALAQIGMENGFNMLIEADKSSAYSSSYAFGDVNSDGEADIRDMIRLKKRLAGLESDIVYYSADFNADGRVDSIDLAICRKKLLGELILQPVCEHPGVAEEDAHYSFFAADDNYIPEEYLNLTSSDGRVKINGMKITVPYEVRNDGSLTLMVTDSRTGKTGGYTMSFTKYTERPTFNDDFDTIDSSVWKVGTDNEGNPLKSGVIRDGKLVFTVEKEGDPNCHINTENSFSQGYGCFSAVMQMPAFGSGNSSFFLIGNNYKKNPLDGTAGWNGSWGEIDVVEYYPDWGNDYAGTVHWYLWNPEQYESSGDEHLHAYGIDSGFHTYSVVWTKDAIYWYFDSELKRVYKGSGVTDNSEPMNLCLQLSPSYEDFWNTTYDPNEFPYELSVDSVTVWDFK